MMIYGAVSIGGDRWYTNMNEVFGAIGNIQENYNWLVTDWVAYGIEELDGYNERYFWLTRNELARLLEKYPSLQ